MQQNYCNFLTANLIYFSAYIIYRLYKVADFIKSVSITRVPNVGATAHRWAMESSRGGGGRSKWIWGALRLTTAPWQNGDIFKMLQKLTIFSYAQRIKNNIEN